MDKEAALLVVAKELFLEGRKIAITRIQGKTAEETMNNFADEFLAFYNKLKTAVSP